VLELLVCGKLFELCEPLSVTRTVVCHKTVRDSVATELLLQKLDYGASCGVQHFADFKEVRVIVYKDYIVLARKTEEISCYSAPGSVWGLVCL